MAKILVIDDETQLVDMVQMRLEAAGYEVVTSSDGEDGLEKAKTIHPDLIMCDVMMPKMDGYKVCGLLKNDARFSKIPVILFTARAQQDDHELGDEVGADAYVTKPFEPPVLLAKIEELLGKQAES